jgi:neurofibromin 1
MTGFLLALGGVCLQRKSPAGAAAASGRHHDWATRPGGGRPGGGSGITVLPHSAGQGEGQYCPVTQFLGYLLRLLVCLNEKFGTQIQKHVKELVGHEMSPALYPILFDQIKIIVEKFFDQSGQVIVIDTNTQFIEHIIFIMKNVLEAGTSSGNNNSSNNNSSSNSSSSSKGEQQQQHTENLGQTSIELMMLAIVRYVRHLDTTVHALHIKTRLCQLVEAMMKRRDDLAFRYVTMFRSWIRLSCYFLLAFRIQKFFTEPDLGHIV